MTTTAGGTREGLTIADRLRALAGGRGIWALCDQAILSLGNFLTNILLIRHFSDYQFGTYAVLLTVVLFLNNLHASLVSYPLSLAIAADGSRLHRRTINSLGITFLINILLGVI